MSPTRRDTLKAAGAASGLAMLGGHAVAQQSSPGSDDDNPGAQQLEDGEAGVRVGHFVTDAPAVNVRFVPADGNDGGEDTETETGGNETDDNTTVDNTSDAGSDDDPIISLPDDVTGGGNDSGDNETGGNTSDDNTTEDLQLADDSNETNDTAGNETDGSLGGDATTDEPASGGEVLYEEDVTVGESFYTVAATGTADDIQTLLLQDYDAAQVRLVHASPDAPAVDVVAPDASMTLFDGVTFGQGTEYVGVPPGNYSLSVREEADMNDGDEVGTSDVELEAGEAYSVYAVGSPEGGEEEFQLVLNQDGQGADAGLGSDDAPGQQGGGPGQGNQSGGPSSDGPGQSGNASGGPSADESDEADDEPGGPGGAAGPNNPDNNASGNGSGNESENESDDGGLFAY